MVCRAARFVVLFASVLVSAPANAAPVLDAVHAIGQTPAVIERKLGRPSNTTQNNLGEFRDYQTSRGRLTIRYTGGKALGIVLRVNKPIKSASQAVALLGVNVARREPDVDETFRKAWRGRLGNRSIKEVSAADTGESGFSIVSISDEY